MGASHPKQSSPIQINLFINGQPFNQNHDVDSGAPAPIFGLQARVNAKDSEGKDIPVKVTVKNNSINSSDNTTSDNTNGEINSTYKNIENIDNNIAQNVLDNSSYNLFNKNNLENININNISNTFDEKNKSEDNNNENKNNDININNYEKPHKNENNINENNNNNNNNEIKNCVKSDNKENNNNNNNFLKEGVQQKTKFGDEEEETKEKKPETNRGNEIDINMGKKENILNKQGNTGNGKQDINMGSRFAREEKDEYKGINYSESDFEISQNINLTEEKTLEETQVLLDKGLLPLFIKINDFKPLCFNASGKSILKLMLKLYCEKIPEIDESILKDIQLYSGINPLDINKEIQYLNLCQFNIITNKPTDGVQKTQE